MFHDDDFAIFENHTTGIGSKPFKKMGYEGTGLGINGQGIVNPIKVEELPHQVGLGYVVKDLGMSERKLGNVLRQSVNHQQQMMRSPHQFFPTQ